MSKLEQFERILTSLHATALDDTEWSPTSRMIDEFCESEGNFLVFCDGDLPQKIDVFFSRLCYRGQRNEELEREYFEVYHPVDERIPRIRQLPDCQIVSARSLFTEQEIKHSRVYNESMLRSKAGDSLSVRLDGPQDSRIVWSIGDPATRSRVDPATVAAVLGLTPTESQLAVLLAEGRTVRDIASAMDCSYATVRWHMRRIFAKLGVSRQVELVQAVLSLAGLPASGR